MGSAGYPKYYLYRRVVQAKMYIDVHFAAPLDLSAISREAYSSPFHFIRLFKNIYGVTPHRYLVQVRIDHAKELLAKGFPVQDACLTVGFESLSSFSALFKKQTGCTPSGYKQQAAARKSAIKETPLAYVPGCFAVRITGR